MKDDRLYLHHMRERCLRIEQFIEAGRGAFMTSEVIQDAVLRNIEVIGEAAKRVSPATRAHPRLHHGGSGRGLERRIGAHSRNAFGD